MRLWVVWVLRVVATVGLVVLPAHVVFLEMAPRLLEAEAPAREGPALGREDDGDGEERREVVPAPLEGTVRMHGPVDKFATSCR